MSACAQPTLTGQGGESNPAQGLPESRGPGGSSPSLSILEAPGWVAPGGRRRACARRLPRDPRGFRGRGSSQATAGTWIPGVWTQGGNGCAAPHTLCSTAWAHREALEAEAQGVPEAAPGLTPVLCPLRPPGPQDAYSEIAYLFAEFFRDLDIVPSDIIAGLVLLRQRQRAKRNAVLDEVRAWVSGPLPSPLPVPPPQPLPPRPCSPPRRPARPEVPPQLRARGGRRPLLRASRQAGLHSQTAPVLQANNDILAFLSGMPVTRNTKYLDLKNSVSHAAPSLSPSVPSREAGSPEPIPLPRSPGPGRAPARDLGSLPPCDPCSCEGTRAQPPLRAAWSRGAIPVCPAGPRTAPRVGLGRVKGQVPPACPAYSRIYSSGPTAISTRQDPPGRPLPPWGDGRAGREAARGRARTHGDALPRSAIRGGSRPALGRLRLPR